MPSPFLLCLLLLLHTTLAGPQVTTSPSSNTLNSVPSCARACLRSFVAAAYPKSTCPDQNNIDCLCTSNSAANLTLGEGALQCLISVCPKVTASEYEAAYKICAIIPNARPATHPTITASMATPTTILLDGGTRRSSSRSSTKRSTKVSSRSASLTTSTDDILTDPGATANPSTPRPSFPTPSTSTTSTPTVQVSAAAATTLAAPRTLLNFQQIIGVSVGGGMVFLVALGLLFYIFCVKRWRDKRRDSISSFGDDGIPGGFPTGEKTTDFPSPGANSYQPISPKAQQVLGMHARYLGGNRYPAGYPSDPRGTIGLALTPGVRDPTHQDSLPVSVQSYQTTTRLLPEMPTYKLPSHSQRSSSLRPGGSTHYADGVGLRVIGPTPPPPSSDSNTGRPQLDLRQNTHPNHPLGRQPSDPFLSNSASSTNDPRAIMYALERRRASIRDLPPITIPSQRRMPANSWELPSNEAPRRPVLGLGNIPVPPAARGYRNQPPQPQGAQWMAPPQSTGSYSALPGQPQYGSPQQYEHAQPGYLRYTPLRNPQPNGKRPLTSLTTASDTSFEDDHDDDEDDQRVAPASTLSPVAESPRKRTPLSQIRYPVVPGSHSSPSRPQQQAYPSPESPTPQPLRPRRRPTVVPVRGPGPSYEEPASAPVGPFELPERSNSRGLRPREERRPQAQQQQRPRGAPSAGVKMSAKYQILSSPALGASIAESGTAAWSGRERGLGGRRISPRGAQQSRPWVME